MKEYPYLKNREIQLRAVEPEDLEVMYQIENNPEHWSVGASRAPYSFYSLRRYIEESQNDLFIDQQLRLMIDVIQSGKTIGAIDLFHFSPHHQRAEVGVVILKEEREKGYAKQALESLTKYAFTCLQLHQLYAEVPSSNQPSLNLFKSVGFHKAGVLKDWHLFEGRFQDALILQKINNL